jgi:hypothetical protein
MNVEIGRQNIIILFWKERGHAVSFREIHKSEPDIYIGFSLSLHLQCDTSAPFFIWKSFQFQQIGGELKGIDQ